MSDPARWGREALQVNELPLAFDGTSGLLGGLVQAQASLELERRSAPELCGELLAQTPEAQLEKVGHEARFQTWGVAELLLERAQKIEDRDPAEAERLAVLVLAVAGGLNGSLHTAAVVEDLRARAWATLGEARRRQG
ncbi:MAG: hypothetical protein M3O15_11105, partial [Acidobacteriota bacterium]|nr:hypothetical protein [Acidobacteriota bacterium]